ncbi:hypothetical protein [Microbacterium sp. SD291]|uniref:hypothetical protein n=1 Tax=Microbacterium sp. SD291 TaxID=2782007 RepID=UPI001A976724|nr:hypothetical protein [Microbacterium sp. SD291]MBO0979904.1 hypothetical protein [Microbacterium sp. SD291]
MARPASRARAMVLEGHSVEAESKADAATLAKVEVVVLDILRTAGPLVDDSIVALYRSRVEHYPGVPMVTPQRIRTSRARLTRRGHVADSGRIGKSALGNAATVWKLNIPKDTAA